jgi:hypothetical protein
MAIKKYASLEQAQVLDLKGSTDRSRTASLDKLSDFHDYRTEDGYLYARIRAISSRVNKNHDGWPSVELAGGKDIFNKHAARHEGGFTVTASDDKQDYGFSTFLGKPIFVDHNNSNPERARGVIVDAKLHVENQRTSASDDPEHSPDTWVELLLEVDAKSFPKLAKAIIEGSKESHKGIDGFSMGCDVEKSVCNICKNAAVSPDEYCEHVRLKGAEFPALNHEGRKISKKSYENCYGIKFFEISAVFDPADESALTKEVIAGVHKEASMVKEAPGKEHMKGVSPKRNRMYEHIKEQCMADGGSEEECAEKAARTVNKYRAEHGETKSSISGFDKVAENPLPQSDQVTMPAEVDTLRKEEICPVCASDMESDEQCDVCGYVPPPEGMDNPDLSQAQNGMGQDDPLQADPMGQDAMAGAPPTDAGLTPNNMSPVSSVNSGMAWKVHHPRLAGRINPVERPLKPGEVPATNEPKTETILSDQDQPVTQRTAASMIAAINGDNMSNRIAADAPTSDTKADKRTDVEGVGGVMDATNEKASAPDVHTEVDGKGGITDASNEQASAPDRRESLPTADKDGDDSGFNKDKNTQDSGKTRTFDNSNEPNSAVTNETFPADGGFGRGSSWQIVGADGNPFPAEDGGLGGGSAKQGVQPVDPVGKADDRVDVMQSVTSPANNSGKTDTWSGTGGNGVTRQQDPVTRETLEGSDIVDLSPRRSYVELVKIADTEVELGLIPAEEKYERMAELEKATEEEITTTAAMLARVKTAGLKKNAATSASGIGKLPQMGVAKEASTAKAQDRDESLFW